MKYTDEDLIRFADGTLEASRTERLLQAAESNQGLAESIAALDASRLPYKAAFAQNDIPPVPEALRKQVADLVSVSRADAAGNTNRQTTHWQKLAVAACVLLSFVSGYVASTLFTHSSNGDSLVATASLSSDDIAWAQRVADYQSLYVPSTVNKIQGGRSKAEKLLVSITETTGLQTAIPDFSSLGYRFVRAQELGYSGETLVQLVYFKEGKVPLALCFMPTKSTHASEVTLGLHSDLGVAFWSTPGQRFVIVADEQTAELHALQSRASATWLL